MHPFADCSFCGEDGGCSLQVKKAVTFWARGVLIRQDEGADFIRRLVHPFRSVLAIGDPGPGAVSDCLVDFLAAAAGWYLRRSGIFATARHSVPAGAFAWRTTAKSYLT